MAIEVKSNVNFKQMAEEIKKRQKEALEKALEEAATQIVQRTQSGTAADGSSFEKYTDEYAAWKTGFTTGGKQRRKKIKSGKRAGKFRKVRSNFGAAGKVNLTLTGQMLGAIRTKVITKGGELIGKIFFGSAKQAAKAIGNMKKRKFFALSDSQVEEIRKRIQEATNG